MNLFLQQDQSDHRRGGCVGGAGFGPRLPDGGGQGGPQNFLIMHAMAPNVAGVIGSAVAAGVLLATLG